MAWSRFEDDLDENAKVADFSDKAFRLWLYSITFATRNRTRGVLTNAQVRMLFAKIPGAAARHRDELVRLRGWDESEGGIRVHDYDEYHPKDPTAADRQARFRDRNKDRYGNRYPERNQPVTRAVTSSLPPREYPIPIPNPDPEPPPTPPAGVTPESPNPEARGEEGGNGNGATPDVELWGLVRDKLRARVPSTPEAAARLDGVVSGGEAGGRLVLMVVDRVTAMQLESSTYRDAIEEALREIRPDNPPDVSVVQAFR